MVDKITQKIKRYPFQTGILIGFLICLLLVGFVGLFKDNGRTLTDNSEIIREDYLRMTILNYGDDRNADLAGWRFGHLGRSGNETLKLMAADDSISPQLLGAFANAIDKTNIFLGNGTSGSSRISDGTPSSPRKGLSGFAKALLIILGLLVLGAAGLYAASVVKTRKRQKRRSEVDRDLNMESPVNVITPEKARAMNSDTPDTLFDLDALFPAKEDEPKQADTNAPALNRKEILLPDDETAESASDEEENIGSGSEIESNPPEDVEIMPVHDEEPAADTPESGSETDSEIPSDETSGDTDTESASHNDLNIETSVIEVGDHIENTEDPASHEDAETREPADDDTYENEMPADNKDTAPVEAEIPANGDAEKPLVETDVKTDPDSEDELLQMIRGSKITPDIPEEKMPVDLTESEAPEIPAENTEQDTPNQNVPSGENNAESEDEGILIHYQSTYRIGNDMYDEVFSIDQGDVFRGECGISIGETLNNTEPKAVTAFEIWLFDKDDIHTTTWYLMSDFALSNEGISERLLQHGKCERIRKNTSYTLETQTLTVEIKVLDLEYGTEMEERNSYFTNVTFDVIAKSKAPASEIS